MTNIGLSFFFLHANIMTAVLQLTKSYRATSVRTLTSKTAFYSEVQAKDIFIIYIKWVLAKIVANKQG